MCYYANADRHGVITFSPEPDPTMQTLPVCVGETELAVRHVVEAAARRDRDSGALMVPGVPEAESDSEAFAAMQRFRDRCDSRIAQW